jgi:polyvinyl alcohol dehydrogenase (cytochrome)
MHLIRAAAPALFFALASLCAAQQGANIFDTHCSGCHSVNSQVHAPRRDDLAQMRWQDILKALETGAMRAQGSGLTPAERSTVAHFLGKDTGAIEMTGFCPANQKPVASQAAWNGWGVDNQNTRFQPAPAAGLDAAKVGSLKLKWAFGSPNGTTGFSQPTVVDGRVYVGAQDGTVYALDAHTGCIYWRYKAKARIRNAIVIGPSPQGPRAYLGDHESNFYALNADTGALLWSRQVDDQPYTQITGSAKLVNGRLYVPISSAEENAAANPTYACCTFRGALKALDPNDGHTIWTSYTTPEPKKTIIGKNGTQYFGPAGATLWSSPTIDLKRRMIYVTTGNGYADPEIKTADAIIAMDLDSGAIRWSQQAVSDMFNWDCGVQLHLMGPRGPGGGNCPAKPGVDVDFGSSAILVDIGNGREALVAGQKSGMVHAWDPDQNGKLLWETRIGKGSTLGGILWGMAAHDGMVFAPRSDADAEHPEAGGGLFALNAATGKIAWQSLPGKLVCPAAHPRCTVAQMNPASAIPGAVFSGAMDGHLRAYRMDTGEVIWDFDAARDFSPVNGIPTHGGAFSATGVTVVDGMLFVSSGYSGISGNALLAFSTEP